MSEDEMQHQWCPASAPSLRATLQSYGTAQRPGTAEATAAAAVETAVVVVVMASPGPGGGGACLGWVTGVSQSRVSTVSTPAAWLPEYEK